MVITEILLKEHEILKHKLGEMKALLKSDMKENLEEWKRQLQFQTIFGDNFHHAKEEKVYFEWMRSKDPSLDDGHLHCMLREHELGRFLISSCTVLLSELEQKGRCNQIEFKENIEKYIQFLLHHIEIENSEVFPMAEKLNETHQDGDQIMLPKIENLKKQFRRFEHLI